jgi:hypothetical protein
MSNENLNAWLKINRVELIDFPDRSGECEVLVQKFLTANPPVALKNCYLATGFRFQVKIYFGGAQHAIGSTSRRFAYKALRFADMAILYFWKYRKTKRKPIDDDFNYSLASAESDCTNIPQAVSMLSGFEQGLDARGLLPAISDKRELLDLQTARVETIHAFHRLDECFRLVYFQCPVVPETKLNLEIAKERIEELGKILKTVDSVVRKQTEILTSPTITTDQTESST